MWDDLSTFDGDQTPSAKDKKGASGKPRECDPGADPWISYIRPPLDKL